MTSSVAPVREALLAFYDASARDLPWRRTRDPYAIWVSEVMLQQTRVETVIPYWERFMARFPRPHDLASAHEDEVLAQWSGLGYYRRARLLHAGVREVVERYGGEVPEEPEARRSLPGVGRYTAGAIGSIAFAREEPILDGNVMRVLSRLHGIDTPLGRRDTEAVLWREAEALVRGPRPGDLNQALMELGARVCTPRNARCTQCPVQRYCTAQAEGRVDALPVPRPKRAPREVELVAVVALGGSAQEAVAMRRGEGALFGGLWGVPSREGRGVEAAREALDEAGVRATLEARPRGEVEHVLTHRRLRVEVWRAEDATIEEATGEGGTELVILDALGARGVSRLTRKLLARAAEPASITQLSLLP